MSAMPHALDSIGGTGDALEGRGAEVSPQGYYCRGGWWELEGNLIPHDAQLR